MRFQVRATRRADKGYDLSFGKGANKLTAIIRPKGQKFTFDGPVPVRSGAEFTFGAAKSLFEQWATANYQGQSGEGAEPSTPPPPPVLVRAAEGPPPAAQNRLENRLRYVVNVGSNLPQVVDASKLELTKGRIVHAFTVAGKEICRVSMSKEAVEDLITRLSCILNPEPISQGLP